MTQWKHLSAHAKYSANGIELELIVEKSDIPKSTAWYWKITDEEGTVIKSGVQDTIGQAKSVATRFAKAHCRSRRGVLT